MTYVDTTADTSSSDSATTDGVTTTTTTAKRTYIRTYVDYLPDQTLRVSATNTRYFIKKDGTAVFLAGSHTWNVHQDMGVGSPPPVFDYDAWLDFIEARGHNCFRYWSCWEQSRWATDVNNTNIYYSPDAYSRSGTAGHNDGGNKMDLDSLNQDYFDRLRERVIAAGDRGIYCIVIIFNGWSVSKKEPYAPGYYQPFDGHPYHPSNNVNSIDGDTDNDGEGEETQEDSIAAVTTYQKALAAKYIDTLNDLDNVLWEVCNETWDETANVTWNSTIAGYIQTYEATKAKQHPVGVNMLTANADAVTGKDWVSYNSYDPDMDAPPAYSGSYPLIIDSDHNGGIVDGWNPFRHFCRGHGGILYMDNYDGSAVGGGGTGSDDRATVACEYTRDNLGYVLTYANQVPLLEMTPQGALCSTGYCLAKDHATAAHYVCYQPGNGNFTLDLSTATGTLNIEWRRCSDGATNTGSTVSGGDTRTLTLPGGWTGDVVAYVYH